MRGRLKLDAHGCVLCVFFLAHSRVWFCDVASFSDASGMVYVRVEPVSILTHQTQCSGFRKERYLADNRQTLRTRHVPCAYSLSLLRAALPSFRCESSVYWVHILGNFDSKREMTISELSYKHVRSHFSFVEKQLA